MNKFLLGKTLEVAAVTAAALILKSENRPKQQYDFQRKIAEIFTADLSLQFQELSLEICCLLNCLTEIYTDFANAEDYKEPEGTDTSGAAYSIKDFIQESRSILLRQHLLSETANLRQKAVSILYSYKDVISRSNRLTKRSAEDSLSFRDIPFRRYDDRLNEPLNYFD